MDWQFLVRFIEEIGKFNAFYLFELQRGKLYFGVDPMRKYFLHFVLLKFQSCLLNILIPCWGEGARDMADWMVEDVGPASETLQLANVAPFQAATVISICTV
ncbi:MAG: hypothetical protein LBT40_07245 [Deltaproteobacteria bacterium]|jgi:hypothetical protein|nr:hypothetical protein [Deltaproteobacteria bacterium]